MPAKDTDTQADTDASEPTVEPTITAADVIEAQGQHVRRAGSCSNPNWTPTVYTPYVP